MSQALVAAEVSMINGMERLNAISHNLANSSATGYKKDISFNQAFDHAKAEKTTTDSGWQGRLGTSSYSVPTVQKVLDLQPGKLRQTGNKLDVAIKGNGFLEVNTPGGERYTRAGSLSLDSSGRLVTSSGHPINGVSGEIRLTTSTPTIDKNGEIWDGDNFLGQIKIVQFRDTSLMKKQGDGLFISESPKTIAAEFEEYGVYQGYVEASNVNMMNEMVNLIETMRQIESTQKVISAYDEMMSTSLSTITEV
jgi:flagellar basal-body rod protein FlgG